MKTFTLNNKVIRYLFSNTISNGVNFLSRWLFNYGLARFMSLSEFGIFSFISSLANLFKSFMSFGGQLYLIYKVSKAKDQKYYYYFKSSLLSIIIALGISLCLFFVKLFDQEIINTNHFLFAVLLGSFMVLIQNTYSFFKGSGAFEKEAKGYFIFLTLIVCSLICFQYNLLVPSLINILIIVLCIHILLFIFSTVQLFLYYKKDNSTKEIGKIINDMKGFIKERVPYGFHELQSALYLNAIIIIMGFLVKEQDLALYRSIQIIIVPISILPMIFSQVLLKQLTENINNRVYFNKLFRKFLLFALMTGLFLFTLFYFNGDLIIKLFYGERFDEIEYINQLLLIFASTYLFRFISANYGVLITAKDKQKIRMYATSALIVVTVTTTILLTKSLGVLGAAYANAISYFFIMVVYIIYSEIKLLRN